MLEALESKPEIVEQHVKQPNEVTTPCVAHLGVHVV